MKYLDLKFLKDASLLSMANLLNSASNGIIIILLNKNLAPDQSGIFLFLLSIASPIFIFLSFDLRRKLTTNLTDGLSIPKIFAIRNILALVGIFVFFLIVYFVSDHSNEFYTALLCIGFGKIFDSISDINYAIFQHANKERNIFISRLIKVICCLAMFLFYHPNNFYIIFSLFVICNFIPFATFEVWQLKKIDKALKLFDFKATFSEIKHLVVNNISLAFASLIMVLSPNIPTYFIKAYLSIENVTYFSSINFIISTVYLAGSGVGYAMLKKLKADNYNGNANLLLKSIFISFACYFLVGLLFYPIHGLTLLFNKQYEPYYLLFYLLLLSGFLFTVCSFLNNYLLFLNERKSLFRIRTLRLVINVLVCIVMPYYWKGLNTFGYALVLVNFMDALIHIWLIKRKENLSIAYGYN